MTPYKLENIQSCEALDGASVAFGVFDGVHKGHQYLLNCAIASAQAAGVPSVALTFDIDPDELFGSDEFRKLQSNEARLEMLEHSGVDVVVTLPFTREFAATEHTVFLEKLFSHCTPSHIHVGNDMRYGFKGQGTVDTLRAFGDTHNMEVHGHNLVCEDGQPITSTRIRTALGQGDIAQAAELLGHTYMLEGTVVPGRGKGTDFGFATANLQVDDLLMVLSPGVYGCCAYVGADVYKAAVSVGVSPTFASQTDANVEVHLLDFEGDLYNAPLRVEFLAFIRPLRTFASQDDLVATVTSNIAWVRDNIQIATTR